MGPEKQGGFPDAESPLLSAPVDQAFAFSAIETWRGDERAETDHIGKKPYH